MAESAETRQLSGLARSIDALFASPPPVAKPTPAPPTVITPAPPRSPEPPPIPEAVRIEDVHIDDVQVEHVQVEDVVVAPVEPPPLRPEMFPASQMLDAISVDPWPSVEATPASAPFELVAAPSDQGPTFSEAEPLLEFGPMAATDQPIAVDPVAEYDVAVESPATEPAPPETQPVAPERDDPRAFRRAVDAYVAGEPGARSEVESLAAGLRDRLALDPLADAVETLVREAGDPPDSRFIELASAVINPAVASRLVQRMGQDPEGESREGYFGLCRRVGRPMANALKGALTGALDRNVRRVYHDALISMGEVSRPVIEGMVQDDNRFLARDGVAILGEIGGPNAIELVTSALADTDTRVRSEALLALGKLGDEKSGQLVLASLEDPDSGVRIAAAQASGQLGLERALRPLLHMLEGEEDPEKCIPILRALGEIGDPGAVHAIEKHAVPTMFSKPRTEVRVAAYRALHKIGTPHARDLIKQTLHDKDPVIRVALKDLTRGE